MQAQTHPLEPFFQQAVRNSYEGKLGLHDPDVTGYVARLLCEFSEADNLYRVRDEMGRPIEELEEMLSAVGPGPRHRALLRCGARFAQAHRRLCAVRGRHVSGGHRLRIAVCAAIIPASTSSSSAGKESYFIVSQFNLFEYEQEAPLFARLSDRFERCILGLTLVREELGPRKPLMLPPHVN